MARQLDELPWGHGSLWPWGRWRSRDERGWPVAPPPSLRFRRLPQAPVCELQDGREEKSASPHLPQSSGDSSPPCHGPRESSTGWGDGRCGQRARGQGWKVRATGRPPGSEELGWQVTGPGNWSSPGAHGLAGEGELQPFLPWMVGLWLRELLHPSLRDGEPAWLPAHSPGQWEPWAHPSLCRISGASVLTSTSAEGSSLSASHGRLLPASVSAPGQARFPTPTPDPCAWPCMCVCMCARVSAYVHVHPCVHTHPHLHACPCVHVCARVSAYVHVRPCARTPTFTYMPVCACALVCTCICMCASVCAYEPMFTHMSTCAYMLVRVHVCVRVCVCQHVCTCLWACMLVHVLHLPRGSVGGSSAEGPHFHLLLCNTTRNERLKEVRELRRAFLGIPEVGGWPGCVKGLREQRGSWLAA